MMITEPRELPPAFDEWKQDKDQQKPHVPQNSAFGHKPSTGLYILIAILVLFNLITFFMYSTSLRSLRQEHSQTLGELASTKAELSHYTSAYQTAVQDAQAFSKIYNINYKSTASSNNTITQNSKPIRPSATAPTSTEVKRLPKANIMTYYLSQGIVNDSCIPTTKLIQTPDDIVEIVIIASGKNAAEWPTLSLLVDGTIISNVIVNSDAQGIYKTTVELPKGAHYLDIVYSNAERSDGVTISTVRIGDRTLETENSILDFGSAFGLFDCNDTENGSTLKKDGTMRFRIEKM